MLKRHLELCHKYGMTREFHLFGLVHNWAKPNGDFVNITDDYPDPIRLRYSDKADGCAKYMRKSADIKTCISALFFSEAYFPSAGYHSLELGLCR